MKKIILSFFMFSILLTGCEEGINLDNTIQENKQAVTDANIKEEVVLPGELLINLGNDKYFYAGANGDKEISIAYLGYSYIYESFYAFNVNYPNAPGTIINLPEHNVKLKIIEYDRETNGIIFEKVEQKEKK